MMPVRSAAGLPVPMLNIQVFRREFETPEKNIELTQTELQNYYVVPEDALGGSSTRRLSFREAIGYFIV